MQSGIPFQLGTINEESKCISILEDYHFGFDTKINITSEEWIEFCVTYFEKGISEVRHDDNRYTESEVNATLDELFAKQESRSYFLSYTLCDNSYPNTEIRIDDSSDIARQKQLVYFEENKGEDFALLSAL